MGGLESKIKTCLLTAGLTGSSTALLYNLLGSFPERGFFSENFNALRETNPFVFFATPIILPFASFSAPYFYGKLKNSSTGYFNFVCKNFEKSFFVASCTSAFYNFLLSNNSGDFSGFAKFLGVANFAFTNFIGFHIGSLASYKQFHLTGDNICEKIYLDYKDNVINFSEYNLEAEDYISQLNDLLVDPETFYPDIANLELKRENPNHELVVKLLRDYAEKSFVIKQNIVSKISNKMRRFNTFIEDFVYGVKAGHSDARNVFDVGLCDFKKFFDSFDSSLKNEQPISFVASYCLIVESLVEKLKKRKNDFIPKDKLVELHSYLKKNLSVEGPLDFLLDKKLELIWKDFASISVSESSKLEHFAGKDTYVISTFNFLKESFVLKKRDSSVLNNEIRRLDMLRKHISEEDFCVALPLTVNDSFLLEKRVKGKTLSEYFDETKDYSVHNSVKRFLAQIHAILPKGGIYKNQLKILEDRLEKSDFSEYFKSTIMDNISVCLKLFDNLVLVDDVDSHGSNYLIADDGKILRIDLPYRGLIPSAFDANKLSNKGFIYELNYESVQRKVNDTLEYYVEEFNKLNDDKIVDERLFSAQFLSCSPLKALMFYCYAKSRNHSEIKDGVYYLVNAIHDIDFLKEKYGFFFSLEEHKSFDKLKNCILELKSFSSSQTHSEKLL